MSTPKENRNTESTEMKQTNKTKVLFLITKSSWGGAQQYVYDLALNIDPEQFEPVVAVGGEGALVEKLETAGIKVIPIKGLVRNVSLIGDIRSFFAIIQIILKERPDVLHVNSSKAGALGTLLGRLLGVKKIIFTAHGWAFNEERPKWQRVILKCIQWWTIFCSHITIVVSYGTKSEMNWLGIQKKMKVVHLGRTVASPRYKEDARGILEMKVIENTTSLSDFHTDFWIGTIAELHPTKQLHRAIDAMANITKKFPHVRYIIIHDGELKTQLQQQVRDLGLDAHVYFTGTIENAARLLPAFDLFALPSQSEAFGYVLIEAGVAGVPVVATEVGGIPDIITNEETGLLVPPRDTPALAHAMERLITDKELRHELASAHQERSSTFTLEKMLKETELLYKN